MKFPKIMIRKKKSPEGEYEEEQRRKIEQIRRMRAGPSDRQTYVSSSGGGC